MKVQINFWNGKKSLEYDAKNIKEAVLKAIKSDANLSYANLRNANLSYANLSDANLSDAKHLHFQICP